MASPAMTTLAAGNKRATNGGFTLVELLVVLVVLGVVSSLVVLALPERKPDAERLAQEFETTVEVLRDAAILEGRPTALEIAANGWRGVQFENGEWIPIADASVSASINEEIALRFRAEADAVLPTEVAENGVLLLRERGSREVKAQPEPPLPPEITFDPDGVMTAFRVWIESDEDVWVVASDAQGKMRSEQASDD